MPSVRELSALYEGILLAPRYGPGVCETCLTFTDGYAQCYPCASRQPWLDAVAPISYSVGLGQLHHALANYKRLRGDVARRLTVELAAVLWRYLEGHEPCLAAYAGVRRFDLVTCVPPNRSAPGDGETHPLERIVGDLCGATRERFARVLTSGEPAESVEHRFDRDRFTATGRIDGRTVLLIDDTWTTGASAQSAAAALKRAGARKVAAVVIGRHLKRDWHGNDARLRERPRDFSWDTCVLCASSDETEARVSA